MYTIERNTQMLISLLKEHGIWKVIVSPGTTNVCFVASIQKDNFFRLFSCVDERSAAYMACGMAAETGEAVALSCTGATASRNYYPGLTEAYYRKLPVLAITSSRSLGQIGQNIDQVTDRTELPKDVVRRSVQIPSVHTNEDAWECNVKINTALIDLHRNGGGPVHINLVTEYSTDFSVLNLPKPRVIKYYSYGDSLPDLPDGNIGIFVGAHFKWSVKLTEFVDRFCEIHDAVVLMDQSSNYKGKYGIAFNLLSQQKNAIYPIKIDLLIHIGDVSASGILVKKEIWRVNADGEVRDTFRKLSTVFGMEEVDFFRYYTENHGNKDEKNNIIFHHHLKERYNATLQKLQAIEGDVPFSNVWIALQLHDKIPNNCVVHFGILNSVRCWNYFNVDKSILCYCNTGGFGIDGNISTLVGASLVDPNKIYFGIVGDLSFFYDMNSIGNRHVGNNIRLLVVNNGIGNEFKNNMNLAQRAGIGDDADPYIAAAGHYGNKSRKLVMHYVEDLGFDYLSAENKDEFNKVIDAFIDPLPRKKSVIFEVFVDGKDDVAAIEIIQTLNTDATSTAKNMVKSIIGKKGVNTVKKIIGKMN